MATEGQFTTGRFELAVDGHAIGQFSELQGITTEVRPVSRQTAGAMTLTLRRRKTDDIQLSAWHRSGMRKNATLAIYGAAGAPVARYRLTNAAATKYETVTKIDSFAVKAKTLEVQTEKITIVVERIERY